MSDDGIAWPEPTERPDVDLDAYYAVDGDTIAEASLLPDGRIHITTAPACR